jgi:transposase InsO family protein
MQHERIAELLKAVHGDGTCHAAWKATFNNLSASVCGISAKVVREFVANCEVCRAHNVYVAADRKMPTIIKAATPWGHVEMDLIDLHQICDLNDGYKYILTAVDHFTRFAAARPLMSKCMEEVQQAVLSIFCAYGFPTKWHTDNGKEFVNEISARMVECAHMTFVHGKARKPNVQGSIERLNHTLEDKMGKYLHGEQKRWMEDLDYIVFAYNNCTHRAIGMAPFMALFGHSGWLSPADVNEEGLTDERIDDYISKRNAILGEAALAEAKYNHKRVSGWNRTKQRMAPEVGDMVYENLNGTEKNPGARKTKLLDAPYQLVGTVTAVDIDSGVMSVEDGAGGTRTLGAEGTKVYRRNPDGAPSLRKRARKAAHVPNDE